MFDPVRVAARVALPVRMAEVICGSMGILSSSSFDPGVGELGAGIGN